MKEERKFCVIYSTVINEIHLWMYVHYAVPISAQYVVILHYCCTIGISFSGIFKLAI